jgi:hypothetical protein
MCVHPLAVGQLSSPKAAGLSNPEPVQTLDNRLQTTVAEFNASGRSMADLALELAYNYQLPMGIEYATRDAVRAPVKLRLKNRNLRDIITALVSATPGFRVDFTAGLVDISFLEARLDPSNLFNSLIPQFDVNNMDTHNADAELLCSLAKQRNPLGACGGSIAIGQWGDRNITLHLRNRKVYEILNAIVAQNGRAVWTPTVTVKNTASADTQFLKNFWYIYPLDEPFRQAALRRLELLFPLPKPSHQ